MSINTGLSDTRLILSLASLFSLLNVFWGNNSISLFLKQFLGFLLNGVVYYLLIRVNKNVVVVDSIECIIPYIDGESRYLYMFFAYF